MCNVKKARIAYVGEALTDGSMEVRELAPALISFAHFVSHAGKAMGCEREIKVMLNQDSINAGSFDITFILNMSILEQAKLFVEGSKSSGLDDLMTVIGYVANVGGAIGVFELIRRIGSRAITAIKKKTPDVSAIYLNDGDVIDVNIKTLNVFLNAECRKDIEGIIKPLYKDGIGAFEIRNPLDKNDKRAISTVRECEKETFKAPPVEEMKADFLPATVNGEMLVRIISLNFEKGKWKVADVSNPPIWVTIADEEFMEKVSNHEITFGKGDLLRIAYRYVTSMKTDGNISAEYIVDKVMAIQQAPKQIKLDFEYRDE